MQSGWSCEASTCGLSRRINILADKALLAAYADPATRPDARNSAGERLPVVFPRHVRNAIADSSYRSLEPSRLLRWTGYLAAALGGAFVVGMLAWLLSPDPTASEPAAAPAAAVVDPQPAPAPVAAASSGSIQRLPAPAAVESPQVAAEPSPEPAPAPAAAMVTAPQQDAVASSGTGTASVADTGGAAATAPAPVVAQETAASPPPAASPQEPAASVGTTAQAPAPVQEEIVAEAVVAAPAVATPAPAASAIAASEPARDEPNAAGLDGLIRGRFLASSPWLAGLPQKTGYSVQIFSVTTDNSALLEEFLEFLVLYDMLDASYLCLISGNSRRKEQWLVLHGEFAGLSEAREFIDDLPPYIGRHSPYARNMEGIACANEAR